MKQRINKYFPILPSQASHTRIIHHLELSASVYPHAVADIAFEQTEFEFTEQGEPLQVCINITNNVTVEANFSITVRTDAEEGTANFEDFEIFEKDIIISTGQTCFEIKIFLDAILEDMETFQVTMESTDSALNVVVPHAEITILDSTSKHI